MATAVGKRGENQSVAMQVGPDQQHRASDAVQPHEVSFLAKVAQMAVVRTAPGIPVETTGHRIA
jgi:hypothetical protein